VLVCRVRLEAGDVVGDLAGIADHQLFSFGKQRLRLDLCELMLRKVAERSGTELATIGEGLSDVDRALLLRNASFLAKLGLVRVRPPEV
jgi:alpha-maltose-1-phosphate synthase